MIRVVGGEGVAPSTFGGHESAPLPVRVSGSYLFVLGSLKTILGHRNIHVIISLLATQFLSTLF